MNQDKDTVGNTSDSFSKDRSLKSEAAAGKGKLAELAQTAASAGKAQIDSGLGQAAGQVEQVAKVLDDTASRLKRENQEGLAAYATQVAGSIESVANRLRHSSVDELATEARQLARSNPVMFLLGSVAIGFGMTRFLKASSRMADGDEYGTGVGDSGGSYGDSRMPTRDWQSGSAGRSHDSWNRESASSGLPGSNWDRSATSGNGGSGFGGGLGGASKSPAAPTTWDRASGATAGTSAAMGSGLGGSSGSAGLGGSSGSAGLGGSSGSSGLGGSSGSAGLGGGSGSAGLGGGSAGLGGSSASSGGLGGSSASSGGSPVGGTRSGTDSLDDLRSKPVFPEMKTEGLKPGGTVGGSRANEVGGGSHG